MAVVSASCRRILISSPQEQRLTRWRIQRRRTGRVESSDGSVVQAAERVLLNQCCQNCGVDCGVAKRHRFDRQGREGRATQDPRAHRLDVLALKLLLVRSGVLTIRRHPYPVAR